MFLTRLFVGRPTLLTVMLSFVFLAGLLSGLTLIQQQFPNVDLPVVGVIVSYPGASTTEMRDAIVRPIEDQIAGAPNLDHIDTTIQQGGAEIDANFTIGSSKDSGLIEVQRRVQAAQSQLPSDMQPPSIGTFDPSQPTVVTLVASSKTLPAYQLSAIVTNKVVPALEQVLGVSQAQANGTVVPALEVRVNPYKLSAAGATLNDVVNTLQANNVRAPGGIAYAPNRETNIDVRGDITNAASVDTLLLAVPGTQDSLSAFNQWSIAPRNLHVGDVAQVVAGNEPQRVYAFFNNIPSITLSVQKASGASEVDASRAVLAAMPALQQQFPQIDFGVVTVDSKYTEDQLSGVLQTLIEGIILTAVVMLFFLRSWRNAVVVLVAIPTSLLVTLAIMRLNNFTLDTVSLLAMTLVIGILVDDSIVVLENVTRHKDRGEKPDDAAINGRSEIGVAAIVITLVDVAVFLPIAFIPGTVGLFLKEFGLVVVASTLTSLFVSFTVTPTLAARWSLYETWKPWKIIDAFDAWFESVRSFYATRVFEWGIRHRWAVVAISGLSFVFAIALVPLGKVGFEFIPNVDRGEVFMQLTYPAGTPLEVTRAAIQRVEAMADKLGDVKSTTALAGSYGSQFGGYIREGFTGQINVNLKDDRKHSTAYWVDYLRSHAVPLAPGAMVLSIPATSTSGGSSQPIDEVVSYATGDPSPFAQQVYTLLKNTPGAANVNSNAASLTPQVSVEFNRDRAQALGVSIGSASSAIRAAFGGTLATQYTTVNGFTHVEVIYPRRDQHDLSAIGLIGVRAANGSIVHVGDIAQLRYEPAPPLITRVNRQDVVHIYANVKDGAALSNVMAAFNERLSKVHFPAGVAVGPNASGNQQNLKDTVEGVGAALMFAVVLVFLLMVALYNSYSTPFIVMFAVPVAAVGALGSLALTNQTLNLFSMIGTVLLTGLVTKNGILLVDFANRQRELGVERVEAIRRAAAERFRPIIMTTVSMIAGMTPVALALEPGSETRRALGSVVIGGLSSSLLLTLVLVPVIYSWLSPKIYKSAMKQPEVAPITVSVSPEPVPD